MSEEQVMETLRLRTAALHRVCVSLDEWRDRAEKAEAALAHVCDGDCRATAEWRQQQIRDLTERLNRVKTLADQWERDSARLLATRTHYANRAAVDAAALRAVLGDAS